MRGSLTWRLWRALRNPDEEHPLFVRLGGQPKHPLVEHHRRFEPLFDLAKAVAELAVLAIAPVLLIVGANFLGALVAFNTANRINHERQNGTYDLLVLMPFDRSTVDWQIAIVCVVRLKAIERLEQWRMLALVTLSLLFFLSVTPMSYIGGWLLTPGAVLVLMVALALDPMQTLIVGCLSGMLGQLFSNSMSYAAVVIFTFVQLILVYLPVMIVLINLNGWLLLRQPDRWVSDGIAGLVALIALVSLREIIIWLMWHALEWRLS